MTVVAVEPVRVIVPYVHGMLNPGTVEAVQSCGLDHRFYDMDPADDGAYGRLVRHFWQEGGTVIVVEQDVIPSRDQLAALVGCGHRWCSYSYADNLYPRGPMFGCVRLSGDLMGAHPLAAEVALVIGKRRDVEAEWWRVDALMARDLMIRGEVWVEHQPAVVHAHLGPPSGPP